MSTFLLGRRESAVGGRGAMVGSTEASGEWRWGIGRGEVWEVKGVTKHRMKK